MSDLLRKLELTRKQANMTDSQFARHLGMDRGTWRNTRLGLIKPGRVFMRAVLRTYPKMGADVLEDLLGED